MPKRRTDTHCFAPGCHSGYPGAPKASLFAAPLDDELRKKWEQNLGRLDKPLTISSAVCERHFEPECILRDYIHVINGSEVRLARGKPSLAPSAVPTILPDCASSVRSAIRKPKRKRPATTRVSVSAASKKPRQSASVEKDEVPQPQHDVSLSPQDSPNEGSCSTECEPFTISLLEGVKLPSKLWCRLNCNNNSGVLFATTSVRREEKLEILHEKSVLFCPHEDKVAAEIFFRGVLCGSSVVDSLSVANSVLQEADGSPPCKGAMTATEFSDVLHVLTPKLRSETTTFGDAAFSIKCLGKVSPEGNLLIANFAADEINFTSILRVILTCAPPFRFIFSGAVCAECKATRKCLQSRKSRTSRPRVHVAREKVTARRFRFFLPHFLALPNKTRKKLAFLVLLIGLAISCTR